MYNAYSYSSIPMGGDDDDSTATMQAVQSLLRLVRDVAWISATGFNGRFKKECTDLSRRVALLSYLVEEIWDFQAHHGPLHFASSSSSFICSIYQLTAALTSANMLLQSAGNFDHNTFPKRTTLEITTRFHSVTCKLDKALAYFPYGDFEISEDVKEQVDLVRGQLKRATQRYSVKSKVVPLKTSDSEKMVIPDEFLCPISGKLICDPVIVSTGQTYERSCIRRWINGGNTTCPKTCKELKNMDLTPNCVLRSLIGQWCEDHDVEQPTLSNNKPKPVVGNATSRFIEHLKTYDIFIICFIFLFVDFYGLSLYLSYPKKYSNYY